MFILYYMGGSKVLLVVFNTLCYYSNRNPSRKVIDHSNMYQITQIISPACAPTACSS